MNHNAEYPGVVKTDCDPPVFTVFAMLFIEE